MSLTGALEAQEYFALFAFCHGKTILVDQKCFLARSVPNIAEAFKQLNVGPAVPPMKERKKPFCCRLGSRNSPGRN